MSRQRSLEQERAKAAWEAVQAVKSKKYEKEYGQLARSAAADVQANGLGQTLAFWRAKGYENSKPKPDKAHGHLYGDVSRWVCQQLRLDPQAGDLLNWITAKAGTDEYAVMIDTRDALDVGEAAGRVELAAYADSWREPAK